MAFSRSSAKAAPSPSLANKKPAGARQIPAEPVQQAAADAGFQHLEVVRPKGTRKDATGRGTARLNVRVTPDHLARFDRLVETHFKRKCDAMERAIELLEAELES